MKWRRLATVLLYAAGPSLAGAPITGCLNGVEACSCEWAADDTDKTTFGGLSHPGDFSAAEIAATGLPEAIIKSADASPQACERVCCEALLITDAPAAAQAPAQTGPCATWQHGGGTGAAGCWLGLDNTKRKPPLPVVPEASGGVWTGGVGKLCLIGSTTDAVASCPPKFPYFSTKVRVCYATSVDAAAGIGLCGSWCTHDLSVGTGCGDNHAHMCAPSPPGPPTGVSFCSSNWGYYVLAIFVVGGGLYLGGGIAMGFQKNGRVMRVAAHPHYALWLQLYGLVWDGLQFSRRRGGGGRSTKYGGGGSPHAGFVQESSVADSGGPSSKSSSPKSKDRKAKKEKQKGASSGKKGKRKAETAGLGESLDGRATVAEQKDEAEAGLTAEERLQARQLEERAQQGVHSSQAKVTVVGQRQL